MPVDSLNQTAEGIPDSNPKECALIAGEWLHPKAQPRELSVDNPQLVFRVGFVEPVDQPDQRADVLLGLLKELVGGLGRHRTSGGRTATVGHDKPSLRTEIR